MAHPELLLAEVRDTIDQLNGRPDSTARCLAAVDAFLADRTEENRTAARASYLAIPETQRRYALGDMDRKDWPLQVLVAGLGGRPESWPDEPVSQKAYEDAVAYFEERAQLIAERPLRVPADGPATPHTPAIHLAHSYPRQRVDDPGTVGLRNDYPAPTDIDGITYSSVSHAYWALSVADSATQAAIAAADTSYAARKLAADATRREGWEDARTATMTSLLRAKYTQHPDLAEILLATNDATLIYDDADSGFWGDNAAAAATGQVVSSNSFALNCTRSGPEPGNGMALRRLLARCGVSPHGKGANVPTVFEGDAEALDLVVLFDQSRECQRLEFGRLDGLLLHSGESPLQAGYLGS